MLRILLCICYIYSILYGAQLQNQDFLLQTELSS